jgi:hypothetical protein
MRRLINILSVLGILFAFLVADYYIINKVYAISNPTFLTSWVRALPLQPDKRSVYVEWWAVAGASGYHLRYTSTPFSTNAANTTFTQIYNGTSLNYTHTGLKDNYWYAYQVRAYDASSNSNWYPTNAYGVAVQPAGLKWEEVY